MVTIHPGARIGQDGFGYVPGPGGHLKVPQVGRVIIQDDVEIGANTTIDRGAIRDTVIGEGTKIDNLVQIGHNCIIGRHCIIVGQTGISGSVTLGDYVMLGARSGACRSYLGGRRRPDRSGGRRDERRAAGSALGGDAGEAREGVLSRGRRPETTGAHRRRRAARDQAR